MEIVGWGITEVAAAVSIGSTLAKVGSDGILSSIASDIACVLEVSNFTKWRLSSPSTYMDHGLIHNPPVSIDPGTKEACSFHKEKWSLYGCGGVFAWKLDKGGSSDKMEEIAVLPYVPFQHMWLDNSLSVAVLPPMTYQSLGGNELFHIMEDKDYKGRMHVDCTRRIYDKNFDHIRHKDESAGILIEANFGSAFRSKAVVKIYPDKVENLHKRKE